MIPANASTAFDYSIRAVSLYNTHLIDYTDEPIKITGIPSNGVTPDAWTLYN